MQSILVLSKNKLTREEYVENLIKEYAISNFDVVTIENDTTIGIEEVRIIQKNLLLKPSGTLKAVLLKSSDNLTHQAQNALLKILEEPPSHTIIVITASSKETFLSTILSRCKIIELAWETIQLSEDEDKKQQELILSFPDLDIPTKLKLAQDFSKTKEEALAWVEKMILAFRGNILVRSKANQHDSLLSQYLNILLSLNKTHTILSTTNVNPRFTLEHLLLSI